MNRFRLWKSRYVYAWFELWMKYDYHNICCSMTVCTYEIGFEYVWKTPKRFKKTTHQIVWLMK